MMSDRPDVDHHTPASTADMRAVVQNGYGGPAVLAPGTAPRPTPGRGEVLVGVKAAGIDRGTWHLMSGTPYLLRLGFGFRRPRFTVPGLDLAGVVVEVGEGVTRFRVGDEIFGTGAGSLAEYAVARETKIASKPRALSWAEAAVLAVSGCTGLQAVRDAGRVSSGDRVLILGASGGVGSFAVQLAVAAGAEVTGVCSGAKADFVRSLGAHHVLDYGVDDFADGARHYDVILDFGGSAPLERLRMALAPRGTLVVAGGEGGDILTGGLHRQLGALLLSPFVRQRLTMLASAAKAPDLEELAMRVKAGSLRPRVDRVLPLEQTSEAMRLLVAGGVRGKIAVEV